MQLGLARERVEISEGEVWVLVEIRMGILTM